jgi:hypothetical protein
LQRSDTTVVFEPLSGAFYLGPDREHPRHMDEPVDPSKSYDAAWARVMTPDRAARLVVCKDFPMCLPRHRWAAAPLGELQHVFLIRHPRKTLASMLREARVRTISFSLVAHTQ